MNLKDYKKQFFCSTRSQTEPSTSPQASQWVHLNNAGLAPIPECTMKKINFWSNRFYLEGYATDKDYMLDVLQSRQNLAKLIGCQSAEIAFFQSTAGAVSQVAFGFDLQVGDEVLMWDQEYGSHLYPWQEACKEKGAQLVLVSSEKNLETPTEKFLAAITSKTKVVAFSWVQFSSGAMMDTETVIQRCKQRGIFVFIDAAQGLGVRFCSLWKYGADAIAGGSHKWLTSPVGVGYLALRQEYILKIKPRTIGAMTFGTCDDPTDLLCQPKTEATRYEAGSKQVLEITALGESCQFILDVGVHTLFAETCRLARRLRNQIECAGFKILNPRNENSESENHFVNFTLSQQPERLNEIAKTLNHHRILYALRGGGVRLSLHAFNGDNDIEAVLQALGTIKNP